MATRKVGSRRLVVDGMSYRWRIRHRATYSQADYGSGTLHVAVEWADKPGTLLVLDTDRRHPADWDERPIIPVLPSDVATWIRAALRAGWCPAAAGAPFRARTTGTLVEKVT